MCRCSVRQIENYRKRISGPLLDRIDIHVEVPLVNFRELTSDTNIGESSAVIRERVAAARNIQVARLKTAKLSTNAAMGSKQVRECCKLDAEGKGYLEHAMEQMKFSARAHDRILKVARTLADLAGKPDITSNEVLEAIQFRSLDRQLFEWELGSFHFPRNLYFQSVQDRGLLHLDYAYLSTKWSLYSMQDRPYTQKGLWFVANCGSSPNQFRAVIPTT